MATAGARFTVVTSEKWEDDWYLGLTPQQRNLYDFLCEGNHGTFAGIFKLSLSTAKTKTRPWRAGRFEETIDHAFAGHACHYPGNWWFVRTYLKWNGPRDGGLSPLQGKGIIAIVKRSPLECRVHFWAEYQELMKGHCDSEGVGIPLGTPCQPPFHPSPPHPSPIRTTSSSPSGDLTPDQKKSHTAGIRAFDAAIKRHTGLEKPPGWAKKSDFGHAGAFFKERLLAGDTGDDLKDCIAEYFLRQKNYEAKARERGEERHTSPSFTRCRDGWTSLLRAVVARRRRDAGRT